METPKEMSQRVDRIEKDMRSAHDRIEHKVESGNKMILQVYAAVVGDPLMGTKGMGQRLTEVEADISDLKTKQIRNTAIVATTSTIGGTILGWIGKSTFLKLLMMLRP